MRHLTATICVTLALLLGSVGVSSALPQCSSGQYDNCFGTFTYNGETYVGEFRDYKNHGQGTYTSANGNKYVGEWRDAGRKIWQRLR